MSESGTVNAGYGRMPFGMQVCSKTPPSSINQSETVRRTLCTRLLKDTTQSYNHLPENCKSGNQSYVNDTGNYGHSERQVGRSETERSRARESGFGCIDSTLCNCLFKDTTQSYYRLSENL